MIPAFSPFLALRYLVTRRINILGTIGVAFAVWAMLIVDGVFTGFVSSIYTNVRNSAPDLLVTDLPRNTAYEDLREAVEAEAGVAISAPRLRHEGLLQLKTPSGRGQRASISDQLEFDHTKNGYALLLGIDPERERQVVPLIDWMKLGNQELYDRFIAAPISTVLLEDDPDRLSQLLLDDEVEWEQRKKLGLPVEENKEDHRSVWPGALFGWRRISRGNRPSLGEPYDLLCAAFPHDDENGNAVLRTHSLPVAFAGWFGTGNRMFDEAIVMLPIETLRTLLGHDAADPNSVELTTDIAIKTAPDLTPAARQGLQQRLQQRVQQLLPEGSAPCTVLDWRQQNQVFLSAVEQERALMQLVLFVVMLVSAFVIYATLHMMVTQKVKDIGIVAAVGGSPRSIGLVFLISGTIVAVVGTALGVTFGLLSAVWINPVNDWLYENTGAELFPRRLFDLPEIPCNIEPTWVVFVASFAIVLAIVVAALPSRKAARMNPVTALSFE